MEEACVKISIRKILWAERGLTSTMNNIVAVAVVVILILIIILVQIVVMVIVTIP